MRLQSLRIEPAGPTGWSSGELLFGQYITELFGPNGCGKTPVIQSIAYALGYPVKYRDDVLRQCSAAVLHLKDGSESLRIRRKIGSSFDVEVHSETSDTSESFYNKRDLSRFLLELFGFDVPTLTSMGGEPVSPYMATLLPVFFLDQDQGYTSAYKAQSFIRDQYAEMLRLTFGLPPKHPFDQKKLQIEKQKRLDYVDRAVVKKQEVIQQLTNGVGALRRTLKDVDADLEQVKIKRSQLRESRSVKSDAHSVIDALIYENLDVQRRISSEITDLQARVDGFGKIQTEIEIELNTLSLNEEARRLFSSFKDICASPGCGLFLSSSESYGKNLLYLRDQVKDLKRNSETQQTRIRTLTGELQATSREYKTLQEKRGALEDADEVDGLVEAISELTGRLFSLQTERRTLEELEAEETQYVQLLNEREQIQNDLASLRPSAGATDLRAMTIRAEWRDRIVHWLDVLETKNVSRDLKVDHDFDIKFGVESLNQFKGSTLLRVVLAIHTATFELYIRDPAKQFRFMILDTPRQQDIEREAFGNYLSGLKDLTIRHNAQVVFSTTNYHYQGLEGDREWTPSFPGPEQDMFLGIVRPNKQA